MQASANECSPDRLLRARQVVESRQPTQGEGGDVTTPGDGAVSEAGWGGRGGGVQAIIRLDRAQAGHSEVVPEWLRAARAAKETQERQLAHAEQQSAQAEQVRAAAAARVLASWGGASTAGSDGSKSDGTPSWNASDPGQLFSEAMAGVFSSIEILSRRFTFGLPGLHEPTNPPPPVRSAASKPAEVPSTWTATITPSAPPKQRVLSRRQSEWVAAQAAVPSMQDDAVAPTPPPKQRVLSRRQSEWVAAQAAMPSTQDDAVAPSQASHLSQGRATSPLGASLRGTWPQSAEQVSSTSSLPPDEVEEIRV